jgi:hypothetical protein
VALPLIPTRPTSLFNQGVGSGCAVTAKYTALLLFMLGATETTMYPEVAPVGIVMMIDVLLHELTVTGALLSVTRLPLCDAPKPEPVICTWLPTEPVVAEMLLITGAGEAVELIETLSKVAVARAVVLSLLTARPTYTFCAILIVWVVPTGYQFAPSGDVYVLNAFPVRVNFTQKGGWIAVP